MNTRSVLSLIYLILAAILCICFEEAITNPQYWAVWSILTMIYASARLILESVDKKDD